VCSRLWQGTLDAGWRQVNKPGGRQQCYMRISTGIGLQLGIKPLNHNIHTVSLHALRTRIVSPG